jgi:Rrf2 family transcriptional regulator, iron-sulfur cluster assembly transcription factor
MVSLHSVLLLVSSSVSTRKENVMRMSTKGRFAVNALIDLALREPAGPVALASISQRQQISLSYLEQLFSRLRREGMVESTRGPGGGYTLGRAADQISVADIVTAVDEPLDTDEGDERSMGMSKALWLRLNTVMLEHMATITLASLVQEQVDKGVSIEARPVRKPIVQQPAVRPVRTTAPNSVFAFGRSFAG